MISVPKISMERTGGWTFLELANTNCCFREAFLWAWIACHRWFRVFWGCKMRCWDDYIRETQPESVSQSVGTCFVLSPISTKGNIQNISREPFSYPTTGSAHKYWSTPYLETWYQLMYGTLETIEVTQNVINSNIENSYVCASCLLLFTQL